MACRQDQRIPPLKYSNKTTQPRHHSYKTTWIRRAIVQRFSCFRAVRKTISWLLIFDSFFLYYDQIATWQRRSGTINLFFLFLLIIIISLVVNSSSYTVSFLLCFIVITSLSLYTSGVVKIIKLNSCQ